MSDVKLEAPSADLDGMHRNWRLVGAVVALAIGIASLAVGGVAAWASLTLLLGGEPASDPAWGSFIGTLLAPVAVVALVLGAGLVHIGRRQWRRARRKDLSPK